jgi:hypothetical protein
MLIRATLFTALVFAASMPLAADPLQLADQGCVDATQVMASVPSKTPEPARAGVGVLVLQPSVNAPGDILGGRGSNPHARELRQIAIYSEIGNRDGAEMLIGELHQFGVTRQTIQRAIDGTKLHGGAPRPMQVMQIENEQKAAAGWEASQ